MSIQSNPPRRQALHLLLTRRKRAKTEAWQAEMREVLAQMEEAHDALMAAVRSDMAAFRSQVAQVQHPHRSGLDRLREMGWLPNYRPRR